MSPKPGNKADGTPITDEMVEAMPDEAERGYDVADIVRRRGGRPPMGSAPSTVESVRLDPELKRDLPLHAAEEHISVSEAIRRAIGQVPAGELTGRPHRAQPCTGGPSLGTVTRSFVRVPSRAEHRPAGSLASQAGRHVGRCPRRVGSPAALVAAEGPG
jgi:hypothetical protein